MMEEYKIIEGHPTLDCQKWLNQWRHEYHLNILQMIAHPVDKDWVMILLTRTKK